jgi:hypothetical protein
MHRSHQGLTCYGRSGAISPRALGRVGIVGILATTVCRWSNEISGYFRSLTHTLRPRERKRKHYCVVSEEPTEDVHARPTQTQAVSFLEGFPPATVPHALQHSFHPQAQAPNGSAEFVHAALNSQFIQPVQQTPSLHVASPIASDTRADRASDATGVVGFLGRSKYLGRELQDHEGSAIEDTTELPHSSLTVDDWKVLNLRKAFDLPPRAVCESLISTFIAKCDPWMPVVSHEILHHLQNGGNLADISLLLLQALFMAGS